MRTEKLATVEQISFRPHIEATLLKMNDLPQHLEQHAISMSPQESGRRPPG